ncbi:hypothetical protein Nepgr_032281 [Nepenthes gracilis]|uniref:Uncharacterized protein n=1 Tax=Nepenthes gracilis TaxID=150966 RepID=A0AAD3TIB0_NEPGR|nr:hypothetical protein Nepgr_032281 [Nepenthes gracilis]
MLYSAAAAARRFFMLEHCSRCLFWLAHQTSDAGFGLVSIPSHQRSLWCLAIRCSRQYFLAGMMSERMSFAVITGCQLGRVLLSWCCIWLGLLQDWSAVCLCLQLSVCNAWYGNAIGCMRCYICMCLMLLQNSRNDFAPGSSTADGAEGYWWFQLCLSDDGIVDVFFFW